VTNTFQLVAGHCVLDLINTLDWRFREAGTEELLPSYSELLRFAEESSLLTSQRVSQIARTVTAREASQTLRACHDLREAAAGVFYALVDDRTPPQDAIKKLNGHFHVTQAHRKLNESGLRFELVWQPATDAQLPCWILAQAAIELLTGDSVEAIRACADPQCRWLFLDTSKNHTRRWCDMKICGNRMKARRFKAQHQA
jgi:predicted RNA-binding Zn ribbon-like protein